jgi:hypothetical protein
MTENPRINIRALARMRDFPPQSLAPPDTSFSVDGDRPSGSSTVDQTDDDERGGGTGAE